MARRTRGRRLEGSIPFKDNSQGWVHATHHCVLEVVGDGLKENRRCRGVDAAEVGDGRWHDACRAGAGAGAGEVAALLTEEMARDPGRGQGHRTSRHERVRMKIRGEPGLACTALNPSVFREPLEGRRRLPRQPKLRLGVEVAHRVNRFRNWDSAAGLAQPASQRTAQQFALDSNHHHAPLDRRSTFPSLLSSFSSSRFISSYSSFFFFIIYIPYSEIFFFFLSIICFETTRFLPPKYIAEFTSGRGFSLFFCSLLVAPFRRGVTPR